jgi:hypothetical protein
MLQNVSTRLPVFSFKGILSRMYYVDSLPIHIRAQQLLQILVENQGRICYGPNINDFKGIVSNVTLGGKIIKNWKMEGMTFSDGKKLTKILDEKREFAKAHPDHQAKLDFYLTQTGGSMSLWTGTFHTKCNEEAR